VVKSKPPSGLPERGFRVWGILIVAACSRYNGIFHKVLYHLKRKDQDRKLPVTPSHARFCLELIARRFNGRGV
jgi:hypothetical protein